MKFFGAMILGLLIGIVTTLIAYPFAQAVYDYFGPPRVTVMNATGDNISAVTVILGNVRQQIPDLKNAQARTVKVPGRFGECSTRIAWTDSTGELHEDTADDYMENCGLYHAKVVLTPDHKAQAIYEIKNP